MNTSKRITAIAGVLLIGWSTTGASVVAPPAATPIATDDCESTATVLQQAMRNDALASFWVNLAGCINSSDGKFSDCLQEALDELHEEFSYIEEVHEIRLELCEDLGPGKYDPTIDPSEFSSTVDNPLFPLIPGRTLVYEAVTDEGLERIEVTTLCETRVIAGVECVSVRDLVMLDGECVEDTIDWFAQHVSGDVWYFGEIALNFEDGFISDTDGSWLTGVDDAKPGIQMLNDPQRGDVYRQEFLPTEAEDIGEVEALNQTAITPLGTFTGCVQTEDFTPLEPDHCEFKFYAPGVGMVLETDQETGARVELIQIIDR